MKILITIALFALSLPQAMAVDIYDRDPDHTFAFFEFNHMGFSFQRERFDRVDATVTLDLENKVGSVDVAIDVRSISTGSALFNQVLLSESYFDADKFPVVNFKSTKLSFGKFDDVTSVEGNLTIKGTTLPLTLSVTNYKCGMHPLLRKQTCGLNATGKIRRSDFGLGRFAPLISDQITLHVAMEALKR